MLACSYPVSDVVRRKDNTELSLAVFSEQFSNAGEVFITNSPNVPFVGSSESLFAFLSPVFRRTAKQDIAKFPDVFRFSVFFPKSELYAPASNAVRKELNFAGYDLIWFRRFIDRVLLRECPNHIAVELRQVECDQLKKLPHLLVDRDRENIAYFGYHALSHDSKKSSL
jgi:hypothetical protein